MAHRTLRRLAIGVLAFVLAACTGGSSSIAIAAVPRASAAASDAALAATALNDFGLELLRASGAGDANTVLSPASIVLALAMARAGARGETAAEMDRVLREIATDEHAGWLNALDAALDSRSGTFRSEGQDFDVTLRLANATFAQGDYPWHQPYLEALASRFGAGVRLVDFGSQLEAARQAINGWVDERTEGRIPELIEPGVLDELARMVLVNAIYLKAPWLHPFTAEATADGTFTRLDGSTMRVPFMAASEQYRYAEGLDWRAVELPYVGGSLAMTVIVPDDIAAFEATLDGAAFATVTGALDERRVSLALPKFGIESKVELGAVLAAMGMPLAFDPARADFSGMTDAEQLYIDAVIHQANIDVDEKGTTAAAATAIVIRAGSAPGELVELHVDRPFLFALRDVPSGAILFLGRVVEPVIRA